LASAERPTLKARVSGLDVRPKERGSKASPPEGGTFRQHGRPAQRSGWPKERAGGTEAIGKRPGRRCKLEKGCPARDSATNVLADAIPCGVDTVRTDPDAYYDRRIPL